MKGFVKALKWQLYEYNDSGFVNIGLFEHNINRILENASNDSMIFNGQKKFLENLLTRIKREDSIEEFLNDLDHVFL